MIGRDTLDPRRYENCLKLVFGLKVWLNLLHNISNVVMYVSVKSPQTKNLVDYCSHYLFHCNHGLI